MAKDNIKRQYSFGEIFELSWYLFRSKLLNRRIRLIRFPIILRGKNYIDFGDRLTTGFWCRLEAMKTNDDPKKRIIFGKDVQINDFVHISALEKVEIGDGCLLASHVYISDNSHGQYKGNSNDSNPEDPPTLREYYINPVRIGNNCWIGEGVIVMPGVIIGNGCIIGAHSVVNHSIPDNCIAVGSPAKVVKRFNNNTQRWERTI